MRPRSTETNKKRGRNLRTAAVGGASEAAIAAKSKAARKATNSGSTNAHFRGTLYLYLKNLAQFLWSSVLKRKIEVGSDPPGSVLG
jgi:hypothetical protein